MRAEEMSSNVPSFLELQEKVRQFLEGVHTFGSHGSLGGVEEIKESGEMGCTDVPIFLELLRTVFRPPQLSQYRGCGQRVLDLKYRPSTVILAPPTGDTSSLVK